MDLKTYINQIGDEEAARLFGVSVRTAASWRRGERIPRPTRALVIEVATKRKVKIADCYA